MCAATQTGPDVAVDVSQRSSGLWSIASLSTLTDTARHTNKAEPRQLVNTQLVIPVTLGGRKRLADGVAARLGSRHEESGSLAHVKKPSLTRVTQED